MLELRAFYEACLHITDRHYWRLPDCPTSTFRKTINRSSVRAQGCTTRLYDFYYGLSERLPLQGAESNHIFMRLAYFYVALLHASDVRDRRKAQLYEDPSRAEISPDGSASVWPSRMAESAEPRELVRLRSERRRVGPVVF